ncbi:MAG: GNAT family N-acetyltransferase [Alphaproteobacteria bacterium]|nr:GNAT family N-acetyltransferase [Alphaproteobacteria bacterium]
MDYRFEGAGFIIRPFVEGDILSFIHHLQDVDVYENTYRFPKNVTQDYASRYIANAIDGAKQEKPTSLHLAIDVAGEVVGDISFLKIEGHKAELAYWLSPKQWGQGIMPQATKWLCQMAMENMGIIRIYAAVFTYNTNSARVLTKAGFVVEGCMRKSYLKDGKLLDANLFAFVR